jgi:hypothetical protein
MLARQLTRHGLKVSGGALAAMLSENAAPASVPASLLSSTIRAARLLAVRQAGRVISVKVAALTEGVLKTMLLTKLKTTIATLLVIGIVSTGATGIAYRALAADGPNPPQEQRAMSDQAIRNQEAPEKEPRQVKAELERLQAENEALKTQLRKMQQLPQFDKVTVKTHVRHISATEAAKVLKEYVRSHREAVTNVSIGVDARSNDVFIQASNASTAMDLHSVLHEIDVPDRSPRQIELADLPLRYLSADKVAVALDELLSPRLAFRAHPGKGTVTAFGDAEDLKLVEEIILRLDQLRKRQGLSRADEPQKE